MEKVSGTLYKADKAASTFKAERAFADEATGELTLQGSVEVYSPEYKSTLRSEKVVWASKGREIVKAEGRVNVESDRFTMGEFKALWATPNLSRVAVPEMFDKK